MCVLFIYFFPVACEKKKEKKKNISKPYFARNVNYFFDYSTITLYFTLEGILNTTQISIQSWLIILSTNTLTIKRDAMTH